MQTETRRLTSGTQTVKAHQLRDGDTIINPDGDNIPVVQITRDNSLVFIWTGRTGGFGITPHCTIEITARNGGDEDNRDFPAAHPLQVIRLRRDTASAADATDVIGPPLTFLGTETVDGQQYAWLRVPTGDELRVAVDVFTDRFVAYPFHAAAAR